MNQVDREREEDLLARADWDRCTGCGDPCVPFGDGLCIGCRIDAANCTSEEAPRDEQPV